MLDHNIRLNAFLQLLSSQNHLNVAILYKTKGLNFSYGQGLGLRRKNGIFARVSQKDRIFAKRFKACFFGPRPSMGFYVRNYFVFEQFDTHTGQRFIIYFSFGAKVFAEIAKWNSILAPLGPFLENPKNRFKIAHRRSKIIFAKKSWFRYFIFASVRQFSEKKCIWKHWNRKFFRLKLYFSLTRRAKFFQNSTYHF